MGGRVFAGNRRFFLCLAILASLVEITVFQNCDLRRGTNEKVTQAGTSSASGDVALLQSSPSPEGPIGSLISIQGNRVVGWAYDPSQPETPIAVHLYADGPVGTGTLVGTVTARDSRSVAEYPSHIPGNHAFTFDLPAILMDGAPHRLFAHAIQRDQSRPLLENSGQDFQLGLVGIPRGWETTMSSRRIATLNSVQEATYSEFCADAPDGRCKGSLPQGGGFYTLGLDAGGNFQPCRVNSAAPLNVGLGTQRCPYGFSWGTSEGSLAATLSVDTRPWSTALTPNVYIGFQHNVPHGYNYLGGSNHPHLMSALTSVKLLPQPAQFRPAGLSEDPNAQARFLIGIAWYSTLNKRSTALEINLDQIQPLAGASLAAWSATAEIANNEPGTQIQLGGRAWGFPPLLERSEPTTILVNWPGIVRRLIEMGQLDPGFEDPNAEIAQYQGIEVLGRLQTSLQVSELKMRDIPPVMGTIDGVERDPENRAQYLVLGWTCVRGYVAQSLQVDLYLGGPAGSGTMMGRYWADRISEPAVATACGVSGNSRGFRFAIPISAETARNNSGRDIFVYGLSPLGGPNLPLERSGRIRMPE